MADGGNSVRLTKTAVDAAQPRAKPYRLWDSEVRGFGLKVTPAGAKTYIATYRAGTGRKAPQREYTIGKHGVLTPEKARTEAMRILSEARLGADPQASRKALRAEMTVADLCDHYLAEGTGTKKPSTLATDRSRIDSHIKPLLGKRPISSVTAGDVERFMRDIAKGKTAKDPVKVRKGVVSHVKGGKGTASRTVGLLGGIFTYAVKHKLRADNPVRGVERYKDSQSTRFLSAKELGQLGDALAEAERDGSNRLGLAVIRLLATTGARKSEIEALRWQEVDFEISALRLRDSKTGAKLVPIGAPALAVLSDLAQQAEADHAAAVAKAEAAGGEAPSRSAYVFPASRGAVAHWVGTDKLWRKVRSAAQLPDVRLHDLRHTFASLAIGAAGGGNSLAMIGKLLGHADVKTTARYAHLADDPLRQAAERISAAAAAGLAGQAGEVVDIREARQGRGR